MCILVVASVYLKCCKCVFEEVSVCILGGASVYLRAKRNNRAAKENVLMQTRLKMIFNIFIWMVFNL